MTAEKLSDAVEHLPEQPESAELPKPSSEQESTKVETPELDVEQIRGDIEEVGTTERPVIAEASTDNNEVILPPANDALKAQTLRTTLKETRKKLSPTQKALSKVIHQPQVDAISNLTGKTIARPSGILFGGLFAFVGSGLYLFYSYHYHFAYKYIAFSIFFVGGFIIGLLLELINKLFRRSKTE